MSVASQLTYGNISVYYTNYDVFFRSIVSKKHVIHLAYKNYERIFRVNSSQMEKDIVCNINGKYL